MKNINSLQRVILLLGAAAMIYFCIINPPQRYRTPKDYVYFNKDGNVVKEDIPDYKEAFFLSMCILAVTAIIVLAVAGEREVKEE